MTTARRKNIIIAELRSQGFMVDKRSMQFKLVWANFKNRRGGFSRNEVYRDIRALINANTPGFVRARFEVQLCSSNPILNITPAQPCASSCRT